MLFECFNAKSNQEMTIKLHLGKLAYGAHSYKCLETEKI